MTHHSWVGWAWIDGAWQRLAQGESLLQVSRALTRVTDPLGIPDTLTVLTRSGSAPVGEPPALRYQEKLVARMEGHHA